MFPIIEWQNSEYDPAPFNFPLDGMDSEALTTESIKSYTASVSGLNWIHNHHTHRNVLRFSAMMDSHFIKMLSESDPRTLTIVGYFFMLLMQWALDSFKEDSRDSRGGSEPPRRVIEDCTDASLSYGTGGY